MDNIISSFKWNATFKESKINKKINKKRSPHSKEVEQFYDETPDNDWVNQQKGDAYTFNEFI